jgi:predicted 3-demethylubiquinone-9 3-methyltransferase (glyoxalase superfamily)
MQKITPFLWFDDQAEEAMHFYTSIFKDSKIISVSRIKDTGPNLNETVTTATFQIEGQQFYVLNGGPLFSFTPSISFFVNCATEEELDNLWERLIEKGSVFMPLNKYPFSQKYGWLQDKFGVSWQLILATAKQKIAPVLMFSNEQKGKAEEAINFYTSVFKNSDIVRLERYTADEGGAEGAIKYGAFTLEGQDFKAMDSYVGHDFTFTEAISLYVSCTTQEEVDLLWDKLIAPGQKGQCGWLKDKYGVSWQIVPSILGELMNDPDPAKSKRVIKAMMHMHKLDIAALKAAHEHE